MIENNLKVINIAAFGFLTQQVKAVHKDLLDFEAKTDQRFKEVDRRFDRLENKVDSLDREINGKVDSLRRDLPGIVADTMRDVLREERGKR